LGTTLIIFCWIVTHESGDEDAILVDELGRVIVAAARERAELRVGVVRQLQTKSQPEDIKPRAASFHIDRQTGDRFRRSSTTPKIAPRKKSPDPTSTPTSRLTWREHAVDDLCCPLGMPNALRISRLLLAARSLADI
jgi:hypothetical protein